MAAGDGGEDPERADDLFGRWLAHRTQQTDDAERVSAQESEAADRETVPSRPPATDMERQNSGFEPVIMPSVRKKLDQDREPRLGVLRRTRQRLAAAVDETPEADAAAAPTAVAPVEPAAQVEPAPAPPRPPRATSGEEPAWIRELRDAAAPVSAAPVSAAPVSTAPVSAPETPPEPVVGAEDAGTAPLPPTSAVLGPVRVAQAGPPAPVTAAPAPVEATSATPAAPAPAPAPAPAESTRVDPAAVPPTTAALTAVRVPQATPPTAPGPAAEAGPTDGPTDGPATQAADAGSSSQTFSDWVSRMRGSDRPARMAPTAAAIAAAAEVTEPPAGPAETVDPTPPPEPAGPDWRQRFRESVSRSDRPAPPTQAPADAAPAPEADPAPEAGPVPAREPEPDPEPGPLPEPEPEPEAPQPDEPTEQPEPTDRAARTTVVSIPDPYVFKPRRATRAFVTLVFVAGLVASAWLARTAYLEPGEPTIALAATAAFATAVLWAIRATTTITRVTVEQGQLEIVRHGNRDVFDLTSTFTPVEITGTPGHRGWRAQFIRRGQPPYEIDSSVVDPVEFTRVLRFYRPTEPEPTQ